MLRTLGVKPREKNDSQASVQNRTIQDYDSELFLAAGWNYSERHLARIYARHFLPRKRVVKDKIFQP